MNRSISTEKNGNKGMLINLITKARVVNSVRYT